MVDYQFKDTGKATKYLKWIIGNEGGDDFDKEIDERLSQVKGIIERIKISDTKYNHASILTALYYE